MLILIILLPSKVIFKSKRESKRWLSPISHPSLQLPVMDRVVDTYRFIAGMGPSSLSVSAFWFCSESDSDVSPCNIQTPSLDSNRQISPLNSWHANYNKTPPQHKPLACIFPSNNHSV